MPELGQDRPAQDTDVATAALEAKMVRNHRFFKRKFNRTGAPAQDPDVARAALEAKMVRNLRFFNRKFNRTGTRARTRPYQARPG